MLYNSLLIHLYFKLWFISYWFPASSLILLDQNNFIFFWMSVAYNISSIQFSVQSLNPVWLFVTPWTAACQVSLSVTNSQSLTQTHVHWVSDAIQPSHPLSSPSPPTFNLSQHKGLFKWVSSTHQVAKVLELQLQHQSFQWVFKIDFL